MSPGSTSVPRFDRAGRRTRKDLFMKVAISGKGGVGKTTLSAMLAGVWAMNGRDVIALDADPDANLASALGVPAEDEVEPLSEMREMILERTGATDDYGGYFKLNPKVDDIPETYAKHIGPIRLLTLGGIKRGGAGCICPTSALVKALLCHVVLGRDDAVVMDMEAGIEHLGRATAQAMDAMIVVVNDSPWSVRTAQRVRSLAGDIGLKNVLAVLNRTTEATDVDQVRRDLEDVPLIGQLPFDPALVGGLLDRDPAGRPQPTDALARHMPAVESIIAALEAPA